MRAEMPEGSAGLTVGLGGAGLCWAIMPGSGFVCPAMAATPRTGRSWSGDQIRAAFLDFYEQRGHRRMASASLVPDDPTVLLTIAGMLPFKPVFLGQAERPAP